MTTVNMNSAPIFPWVAKEPKDKAVSKWNNDGMRYEFNVHILSSRDLPDVVAHCVEQKGIIEGGVSSDNERAPALYNVFPRTLRFSIRQQWKQVLASLNLKKFDL